MRRPHTAQISWGSGIAMACTDIVFKTSQADLFVGGGDSVTVNGVQLGLVIRGSLLHHLRKVFRELAQRATVVVQAMQHPVT